MDKVYERTENGSTSFVSIKDGLAEVNDAMMGGRNKVRSMSSGRGNHSIAYKDGRNVRLVEVNAPQPVEQHETAEPEWSTASLGNTLLHRFTDAADPKDRRALCNKRFRPVRHGDGYSFKTRTERDVGQYAYLYTYCTRCSKYQP